MAMGKSVDRGTDFEEGRLVRSILPQAEGGAVLAADPCEILLI